MLTVGKCTPEDFEIQRSLKYQCEPHFTLS